MSKLGNKQLGKILCMVCNKILGEHSKRDLIRCIFRLQMTMVSNGINSDRSPEKQ